MVEVLIGAPPKRPFEVAGKLARVVVDDIASALEQRARAAIVSESRP